jgi:hypothetical protein
LRVVHSLEEQLPAVADTSAPLLVAETSEHEMIDEIVVRGCSAWKNRVAAEGKSSVEAVVALVRVVPLVVADGKELMQPKRRD